MARGLELVFFILAEKVLCSLAGTETYSLCDSVRSYKKEAYEERVKAYQEKLNIKRGECKPDPNYDGKRFCRANPDARSYQECVGRC